MQTKELQHCRLAMLAAAGMIVQELQTGATLFYVSPLAPASADNILELKAQDSIVRGQVGWSQQSSRNSCPSTLCYAGPIDAAFAPLTAPAKERLLDAIQSGQSDAEIAKKAARLELLNPLRFAGTTASDLLPGNWLMVYTTSESIAGKNRPKVLQVRTPPEQSIDVANLRARNSETVWGVTNAVDIALQPAERDRVDVRFETFRLGPLAFPAPAELTGSLTTTYLDSELRISRGDKDNLFVLVRESTMRDKGDAVWDGWRRSW